MTWYWLYGLLVLLSAVTAALLAVYAWRHRSIPGAGPAATGYLALTIWASALLLVTISPDMPTAMLWFSLQLTSVVFVPLAWLALILQYGLHEDWLKARRLAWFAAVPAITVAMVWTNGWHGWMIRESQLEAAGPLAVLHFTAGPWFWIHSIYSYLVGLVGFALLVGAYSHAPPVQRKQLLTIAIGVVLPIAGSVVDFFDPWPLGKLELAPLLLGPGCLVMAWGLFRYRLFDLVPIARSRVVDGLTDGVIVLDHRGQVVDLNPAARQIFGCSIAYAVGRGIEDVFCDCPELLNVARQSLDAQVEFFYGSGTQRYYEGHVTALNDRQGRLLGRVVTLRDITERKQVEARLLDQQRSLAVLEERDRLARELHDGLGQVLGYVNTQAQAIRELLSIGQTPAADAHLARLVSVAQDAYADVREYILSLKASASSQQNLFPSLEEYLRRFGQSNAISAELVVPEELRDGALAPLLEAQLRRIVQEALSNVRKHACASSVRVVFSIIDDVHVQVAIEDDGRGFDPAEIFTLGAQSFGLRIMRERAQEVGASVQVISEPGRGTRIIVRAPMVRADRKVLYEDLVSR